MPSHLILRDRGASERSIFCRIEVLGGPSQEEIWKRYGLIK
jgi:hypothetical protein